MDDIHHSAMRAALEEARLAAAMDEVPIGAALVDVSKGQIVAQAGNRTITKADPTAHAEIELIRLACGAYGVQRLPGFNLYVTLEPCPMCAAAISYARIQTLYYGASDPKSGGVTSSVNLYQFPQMHHKPAAVGGLYAEEAAQLLKDFFAIRR